MLEGNDEFILFLREAWNQAQCRLYLLSSIIGVNVAYESEEKKGSEISMKRGNIFQKRSRVVIPVSLENKIYILNLARNRRIIEKCASLLIRKKIEAKAGVREAR